MVVSGDDESVPEPAAAYVRMSTDHQKYSTENQLQAIRKYANDRSFEIVRTYEDSGRSGLRLDGREALKSLMNDVRSGQANFTAILAYDVSRWGRFQDADESAYYEYLCSRAGIRVHYCAEQFENDGSIGSNLLKTVKRVMAGEYSRELSVKVFAGQCRLIELGYRQGGAPGFGLRRQLVDEHGNPKGELQAGQRKSLQTDRVILVPGPPKEVETVRRIFSLFVNDQKTEHYIADLLNSEGILSDLGRAWRRSSIHQILTNEKYVGNNVYNRISYKLKKQRVRNKPEAWVRAEGAFTPLVDSGTFLRAISIIEARHKHITDTELLERLRALLTSEGRLSGIIIDEMDSMPSSSIYRRRFGSLYRAYALIEYDPGRDHRYIEINQELRRRHPEIISSLINDLKTVGASVAYDPATELIEINGQYSVSIVLSRSFALPSGALRWKVRLDTGLAPDITLVVRMDGTNQFTLDYYLLPSIDMTLLKLRLAERNPFSLDAYRFDSLDFFYQLAMPAKLENVA